MDSQANKPTETSPWKQDFFSMFGFGEKPIDPTVVMKEPSAPSPVGDSIFKQILGIKSPPPFKMPQQESPKGDDSFEAVFSKLIQAESSGRHTKDDGSLLEGPKTASGDKAKGITQLMPKTAGNPGYGVKPLQADSKEEYIRFGKDLLKAYTKEFGGDIRKGLAAYNFGIGNVKKIVAKHGDAWEGKLPAETKNYLNKIMGGKEDAS